MTTQVAAPWPADAPPMVAVVGLDPSLTSFGAALAFPGMTPEVYRWRHRGRGHERLAYLRHEMLNLASRGGLVVMEGLAFGAKGRGVLDLAGLHWVLRQALWEAGMPYVVVPPALRAKWIAGKGNASKDECLVQVIKRFTTADVDGNDVADALTLAAMGMEHLGQPMAKMPADRLELLYTCNRDGLPQIAWPDHPIRSTPRTSPEPPENHE